MKWMRMMRLFCPFGLFAEGDPPPGGGTPPAPAGTPKPDDGQTPPAGKDANFWETEAKKAFRVRDELKQQHRELAERLAELEKADTERKAKDAKAKEDEERKALEERKAYEQALAIRDAKFNEQLAAVTAKAKAAAVDRAQADVRVAVSRIEGIVPECVDEVARLLMDQIGMDDNYVPFVADKDGKHRKSPTDPLKTVTIEELAAEYVKTRPYFLKSAMPPASGAGTAEGGTETWSIEKAAADMEYDQKWQKADPEGNKKAWREYLAKVQAGKK